MDLLRDGGALHQTIHLRGEYMLNREKEFDFNKTFLLLQNYFHIHRHFWVPAALALEGLNYLPPLG